MAVYNLMQQNNKKIVVNTGVMYVRLIVTTIIGLFSSRYILLALGVSDYGLYAVVGGLISMLNVLSVAMNTTTRRFINIEMGKPNGNLNKIFNISRLLHIGFAAFIFIIAETIGMFYIYNYLNVTPNKFNDAIFVFQVSTITTAISIVNVPYQSLLEAFEKFTQRAIVDILGAVIKLIFVIYLMCIEGEVLRFYSLGAAFLTLFTLSFYNIACAIQWKNIIKYHYYNDYKLYKEMLIFNNYVALGATSYIARSQASTMLVNFFFGTVVNAAFAVGYTVESFCRMFVSSIGSAAGPQITQNYFKDNNRSLLLMEAFNKYAIFLMLLIFVPLTVELEFILKLWLKTVPNGAAQICHLTLISAMVGVFFGGTEKIIQASGKNKWFQISGSSIDLLCIPLGYILYVLGASPATIVVLFILSTIIASAVNFYLLKKILNFDLIHYSKNVFMPAGLVVLISVLVIYLYRMMIIESTFLKLGGVFICTLITMLLILLLGMNKFEKAAIISRVLKKN